MENKTNNDKSDLEASFATKKDLAKLMNRLTIYCIISMAVTLICFGLLFVQGYRLQNESRELGNEFSKLHADLAEIKALLNQRKK